MNANQLCLCVALLTLLSGACKNVNEKHSESPLPGTVVARIEEPIREDSLNTFTYSIEVRADSNVASGVYQVDADYGPNFARGMFSMPKGLESTKPLIRKGAGPHVYIIGFKLPNDTTFYDYYEIASSRTTTKMKYIKSYTFE